MAGFAAHMVHLAQSISRVDNPQHDADARFDLQLSK
jgi:hypothetical protein